MSKIAGFHNHLKITKNTWTINPVVWVSVVFDITASAVTTTGRLVSCAASGVLVKAPASSGRISVILIHAISFRL